MPRKMRDAVARHAQRRASNVLGLPCGHPFQPFKRVWVFANEQHQCGGLRIGFSTALFPFLQGSFVDPQLARKDRSREAQFLARVSRISFESTLGSGAGSIL